MDQKIMVSGRIPSYVKEYSEVNNISISKLIIRGFESYRENDIDYALKKVQYHEEKVLHYRQKVLQHDLDCNTKLKHCNTIRETFKELGRGNPQHIVQDKNWLQPKVQELQKKGIVITLNELYEICKN